MLKESKYIATLSDVKNMQELLDNSLSLLKYFNMNDYKYDPQLAVDELGIDLDLVNKLVEDYVVQIMNYKPTFLKHLNTLQYSKENNLAMEYVDLRELAHKNLGVVRNLRIKDAEKLLMLIMKEEDLDNVLKAVETLLACAVKLKPKAAYDNLMLLK